MDMDIRQLQTLITLIKLDFSVSKTAEQLFLVQSAVSQQIKKLEHELGGELFIRKGKRLVGLTPLGRSVENQARQVINNINNIKLIAADHKTSLEGVLRIGCTHTQARYILPAVIKAFNQDYPHVELQIHQGNPKQLVDWAINDQVDFSICTEELVHAEKLQSIACYQWNRCLITCEDHPLLSKRRISLKDLADYPIITYVMGFTGRQSFNDTFENALIKPNIVLSAADTDIIKTYVLDGLGIGIIAGMAYSKGSDSELIQTDLSHLFPWEITRIAFLKNKHIRHYEQSFVDRFFSVIRDNRSMCFKLM